MNKGERTIAGPPADKLIQLAALLEQAMRLMREIGLSATFQPDIPKLKRPQQVPRDQEWFWSDEWQAGEQEVNEALAHGDYAIFDSAEALLADLHRHV